jgi:hypothetical protein
MRRLASRGRYRDQLKKPWYDRTKTPIEGVSIIFNDFNSFVVKGKSMNNTFVRIL